MSGDLETQNIEEQSKAWRAMVDSVLDFIKASKTFLHILNEKMEECVQVDRNKEDIKELHVNKSFNNGKTEPNLQCTSFYKHFVQKNSAASEFLDEQYNLMKQAISRRYQPQFRHNIISTKKSPSKDRHNKTFTETLHRVYSVSSERKFPNNKNRKQGMTDKTRKKKPEPSSNVPTYVLYEKE